MDSTNKNLLVFAICFAVAGYILSYSQNITDLFELKKQAQWLCYGVAVLSMVIVLFSLNDVGKISIYLSLSVIVILVSSSVIYAWRTGIDSIEDVKSEYFKKADFQISTISIVNSIDETMKFISLQEGYLVSLYKTSKPLRNKYKVTGHEFNSVKSELVSLRAALASGTMNYRQYIEEIEPGILGEKGVVALLDAVNAEIEIQNEIYKEQNAGLKYDGKPEMFHKDFKLNPKDVEIIEFKRWFSLSNSLININPLKSIISKKDDGKIDNEAFAEVTFYNLVWMIMLSLLLIFVSSLIACSGKKSNNNRW